MKLSQDLKLQLKQKLSLSQEMLISLELIQLPLIDLRERIEKEILENPALEINEKSKEEEQAYEKIEEEFTKEDNTNFLDSSSAEINTGISPTSTNIDLKRQFLEGAISHTETLYDHLISQLQVQNISEEQKRLGMIIISLINEDGFFKEKLEEIFSEKELKDAKDVLEIIQLFDPIGVASSGVQDALLFQIESIKKEEVNENAYLILKNYFELMINRKDNEIVKKMRITINEVKEAFEFISHLNPYPGRNFSSNQTKYIIPDAYVYKREDSLIVEMNEDILPSLTINSYIDKIAKETQKKKKANKEQKYIVEKVRNAHQFMNLINYRKKSLFKLVLILVKMQESFFHKGPKFLKPLTMKQVADEIGLSESTVSRLASSKYIQTEWGIHEIKYFFSTSISSVDGNDNTSSESVKELIKEIFLNEKDNKISDQKIAEILQNKGIKIARRTVAKYRKNLKILPSHQRKF